MHSRLRGVLLASLTLEPGRCQVFQRRVDLLAVVEIVKEQSQAPVLAAEVFVFERPKIRTEPVFATSLSLRLNAGQDVKHYFRLQVRE